MTPAVRIGLIGCGAMGRGVHVPLLTRRRDLVLAAIADPDPSARREAARLAPAAALCATPEELLARADVEAVLIAAPTPSQAALARLAFEHRRHVYLEKPLAAAIDEGSLVLDAWRAAGTIGMIGFNYRFNPLYLDARRLVAAGALGTLEIIRSVFTTRPHDAAGTWRDAADPVRGVLLDLGSHHFDLFTFLSGQQVAKISHVGSDASGRKVAVAGRLSGGGAFDSVFAAGTVDADRVDLVGDRATISIDRYRSLAVAPGVRPRRSRAADIIRTGQYGAQLAHLVQKLRSPRHEPSHARALAHFAAAIRGERPAEPDLADGFRSLQAVTAAASKEISTT